MENLIVYPIDKSQLDEIKSLLDKKKIRYELATTEDIQDWQLEIIKEGLSDIEAGKTIAAHDVHKKALALCDK